jgi:hypothetical protein
MKEKIKFIEEAKIKRELKKAPDTLHANPIKASLAKFINFKKSFNFKDLF